jgi:hypothetical protein
MGFEAALFFPLLWVAFLVSLAFPILMKRFAFQIAPKRSSLLMPKAFEKGLVAVTVVGLLRSFFMVNGVGEWLASFAGIQIFSMIFFSAVGIPCVLMFLGFRRTGFWLCMAVLTLASIAGIGWRDATVGPDLEVALGRFVNRFPSLAIATVIEVLSFCAVVFYNRSKIS